MAMRSFDLPPARLGIGLGVLYTGGALLGVVLGGWLTDKWKIRNRRAPLGMTAISVIGTIPSLLIMASADTVEVFFAGYFLQAIFTAMWSGGTAAMIQDLVLTRMCGAAAASFSLIFRSSWDRASGPTGPARSAR